MSILVTGAAGFLGAHLVRHLRARGQPVWALVRPQSDLWRLADLLPGLSLAPVDLADRPALAAWLEWVRPTVCLHLAWVATPGRYRTASENLTCLQASLILAEELVRVGCRRLVGVGTGLEYGAGGWLREDRPPAPGCLYAVCKAALAGVLQRWGAQTGLQVAWARLFWLYGPQEDPRRLVPQIVTGLVTGQPVALGRGERARDFLHVADAAAALWAVAESSLTGPVNIGSGQPVTVRQVAETIGHLTGRGQLVHFGARPEPPDEPPSMWADITRLRTTGWRPRYSLVEGLRQTVAWWTERLQRPLPVGGRGESDGAT